MRVKRCRFLPLMASLVFFTSAGVCAGGVLRGEGDFEFFVDTASLPVWVDGTTAGLIQIAIPTREVLYIKKEDRYVASIRLELVIEDAGETVFRKGYRLEDKRSSPPVSTDLSTFIYVSDSCRVQPGSYVLQIRIEDINRKKRTLLGIFHKSYYSSELKGAPIDIAFFPADKLVLSDPVFIWARRGRQQFIPNPMQIFGLKNDTLSFYVGARAPASAVLDSLDVHLSVIDQAGQVVEERYVTAPLENGATDLFGEFDVNTFPAGEYRIVTEVSDRSGLYASTGKDFSVAWELVNWQKPRRDVLLEARLLFSESEFRAFQAEGFGGQERILNEFWKRQDPTPHTAVNESYEKFEERVRYSDTHFGGYMRGALSDRGIIYIRYGPPNEIIEETVPLNRNEVSEAIAKLEDQYDIILHSIAEERHDFSVVRPKIITGESRAAFRGLEGMDTGAYELWVYNMMGDPILERDQLMTIHSGYRFLFIDLDGVGNFHLVGTSEESEKQLGENTK